MAYLYITEYAKSGLQKDENIDPTTPLCLEPAVTTQRVTFTTATQSTAFNGGTHYVRVIPDADCHILFGTNPTATANHPMFIANVEYWMAVTSGLKLSVYDGSS